MSERTPNNPINNPGLNDHKINGDRIQEFLRLIITGVCDLKQLNDAKSDGLISLDQHDFLITEYAQQLELVNKKLEEERHIDVLTGLPNDVESKLEKLIEKLNISNEHRKSTLGAIIVVFIDLNGFKQLNDTHGHEAGDKALIAFADRLKSVTKEGTDMVFRIHGDEFVVIMPIENDKSDEVVSDQVVEGIFQRIIRELYGKANIGFEFSASMGYSVIKKGESKTAVQMKNDADLKMYEQKRGNK